MAHDTQSRVTNRRTVLKALGAGSSATLLAGCTGGNGGNGSGGDGLPETLKIGMLSPFSGGYGFAGEFQNEGLQLAVDEFNNSDEILPETTLEIETGDTETDPDTGLSEARRLVQREEVDLLTGGTSSAVASVLSQYAESEGMMYFIIQAADRALTTGEDCRPVTYRPNPHTHQAGRVAGQWPTENIGKKAFVLYQDYSYGQATREAVGQGIEEAGGEIVDEAATPLGNQQFESVIDQIRSSDAEWLMMGAVGTGANAFLTQAANRGLDIPITSQNLPAYNAGEVGEETLNALSDIYRAPCYYTREIDTEANRQHVEAFQSEFDHPPNYSTETGYMVGRLIGEGLHEAGTLNPSEARSTFEGFEFESPRGANKIRECDHQGTPPMYIGKYTGIDNESGLGVTEILEQLDSNDFTDSCEDAECEM